MVAKLNLTEEQNYAARSRVDLLEIIYRETNDFLLNDQVIEAASVRGKLEAVKYLTERCASCTGNAMDAAAQFGHLEVVKYLHLTRPEGCFEALLCASGEVILKLLSILLKIILGWILFML